MKKARHKTIQSPKKDAREAVASNLKAGKGEKHVAKVPKLKANRAPFAATAALAPAVGAATIAAAPKA